MAKQRIYILNGIISSPASLIDAAQSPMNGKESGQITHQRATSGFPCKMMIALKRMLHFTHRSAWGLSRDNVIWTSGRHHCDSPLWLCNAAECLFISSHVKPWRFCSLVAKHDEAHSINGMKWVGFFLNWLIVNGLEWMAEGVVPSDIHI